MLVFLKLGGSLITDKTKPYTARIDKTADLVDQIKRALQDDQGLKILLGHGSGSFGHESAARYHTRQGVHSAEDWHGFAKVWQDARELNSIVLKTATDAGLSVVAFPPSASCQTKDHIIQHWTLEPVSQALSAGLLPVIFGDVVFDHQIGGTILSTEDLFLHAAKVLAPERVLIAGAEQGVWQNYEQKIGLIDEINERNYDDCLPHLAGSKSTDVTGGMRAKVDLLRQLVHTSSAREAVIFSGEAPNAVYQALLGQSIGTRVTG